MTRFLVNAIISTGIFGFAAGWVLHPSTRRAEHRFSCYCRCFKLCSSHPKTTRNHKKLQTTMQCWHFVGSKKFHSVHSVLPICSGCWGCHCLALVLTAREQLGCGRLFHLGEDTETGLSRGAMAGSFWCKVFERLWETFRIFEDLLGLFGSRWLVWGFPPVLVFRILGPPCCHNWFQPWRTPDPSGTPLIECCLFPSEFRIV